MGICNPKTVQAIKKTMACQHNWLAQRELGLEYSLVGVIRLAVVLNHNSSHSGCTTWMRPRSDSLTVITGNKVWTQTWKPWACWIPFSLNSVWLVLYLCLYSPSMTMTKSLMSHLLVGNMWELLVSTGDRMIMRSICILLALWAYLCVYVHSKHSGSIYGFMAGYPWTLSAYHRLVPSLSSYGTCLKKPTMCSSLTLSDWSWKNLPSMNSGQC